MMPIGSRGRAAQGAAGYRRDTSGGGGDGDGGSTGNYLYDDHPFYGPEWRDPPTRSNTDYVSNYSSLGTALANVNEDTTLYLDNGPYTTGGITLQSSHVTVSGEGYSNTVVNNDYSSLRCIDTADWNVAQTTCDTITAGDTTITGVGNPGLFSAGDELQIYDSVDEYDRGNPGGSGSIDAGPKSQMTEVQAVDSGANTVTIDPPAHFDYAGPPDIGRIDWGTEGVHFTNFTIAGDGRVGTGSGDGTYYRLLVPRAGKDMWTTNMRLEDVHGYGAGVYRVLNYYSRDCESYAVRNYGTTLSSGTTNAHIHNWNGQHHNRYAVSSAMTPRGGVVYYLRTYNCVGKGVAAVVDAHFGVENLVCYNTEAYSETDTGTTGPGNPWSSLHRLRGHQQWTEGGQVERNVNGADLTHAQQWPGEITFRGLTSSGSNSDHHGVILRSSGDSTAGSWFIDRCEIIDVDFHGNDYPISIQSNIDELYVSDYYWNGTLLTQSDIDQLANDSGYIVNSVTVENTV